VPGHYDETEQVWLFGRLSPGKSVTVKLVAFPGDLELLLTSDVCLESGELPGYYYWDTTKIDWAGMVGDGSPASPGGSPGGSPFSPAGWTPVFPLNVLYVMTDSLGNEFSGKFLIGSYPEQVRRTFSNVQTLM